MVRYKNRNISIHLTLFFLFIAQDVHAINASTRVMREQMEAAFRKELVRHLNILILLSSFSLL